MVLAALAAASAFVTDRLPARRIVRSRYGDAFFLTWSALDVLIVSLAALADGGVSSPAMLLLFLALIYAALSYPRWMVVAVSAMSVLAVAGLAVTSGLGDGASPDWVSLGGLLITLIIAGALCVAQAQMHAEQRRALTVLSASDPLTGCLNRRGFAHRLERELERSRVDGDVVALLQLDLDRFKAVNDRDGHAAGDALLAWVAATTAGLVRPGDAVGRIGGDEFAVLLPASSRAEAEEVAERIRAALAERIGVSVGTAVAGTDLTSDDLHRAADERLYAAKRAAAHVRGEATAR